MTLNPAGSFLVSEKALNLAPSLSSNGNLDGIEKVCLSLGRGMGGRWMSKAGRKYGTLETRVKGCNHLIVTASASVEKDARTRREFLQVESVSYRPPGTQFSLLDKVSMSVSEKSLNLVYGPSGSGKTTLLQVLGGLATPTEGSIHLGNDGTDVTKKPTGPLSLSARVGIVFQFPERYFLTDTIVEELLFGHSRQTQDLYLRQTLTRRLQTAIIAVGLSGMPLDRNPRALSDGYKRRLALAVQLVRMPDVLLLDEPLAGLGKNYTDVHELIQLAGEVLEVNAQPYAYTDWSARADVVRLLSAIKKEKTVIVVSHDLKEFTGLVDKCWRMDMGGKLTEQPWDSRKQMETLSRT